MPNSSVGSFGYFVCSKCSASTILRYRPRAPSVNTAKGYVHILCLNTNGTIFTPWISNMSLCTYLLYFALSDAILKRVLKGVMGMQRTELSRHLPKFTRGDPVLTLICEYEVSTFDSGTGIVPKLWPSSNDIQLGSHYSGTFLSLPMLLFSNVFFSPVELSNFEASIQKGEGKGPRAQHVTNFN